MGVWVGSCPSHLGGLRPVTMPREGDVNPKMHTWGAVNAVSAAIVPWHRCAAKTGDSPGSLDPAPSCHGSSTSPRGRRSAGVAPAFRAVPRVLRQVLGEAHSDSSCIPPSRSPGLAALSVFPHFHPLTCGNPRVVIHVWPVWCLCSAGWWAAEDPPC